MLAAVARRGVLVVEEVAEPVLGPGDALVAVKACGICGSDLHALHYADALVAIAREIDAPLSFDRPEPINHVDAGESVTAPIEGRAACHVAPAEWRMLGWLEREGFAYDLYSETQLDAGVRVVAITASAGGQATPMSGDVSRRVCG